MRLMLVAVCLTGVGDPVTGLAFPAPRGVPPAGPEVQAGSGIVRPVVRPPRLPQPPVIDGRLDDAVWSGAAHITELVQRRPFDGVPASEASDIYLGYDSDHLYVGMHAHYRDPGMLRANRRDRDENIEDDLFLIYFDPFLDRQRAYVFTVNGYGVQGDAILRAGAIGGGRFGVPRGDASWDVLFETAAEIVADGFVAEMAIPFKSLRYPRRDAGAPHRWGLQIARIIGGRDEADVWSPTSRDIAGFLPQMGTLDGMTDLSRSHNLEILPTLTAIRFGALDRRTGAFEEGDLTPEGGVNVKYGVTSNLTADVTLNPDFSQIESDLPQIEINQRFALFYPELRPFFLEGAEIFNIPAPVTAVHTRTIVDPDFGAKLTGKIGRTTLGAMYASDAAPGIEDASPGAARSGAAQVLVGRVRYDLYAESHVGTVFTSREHAGGHSWLAGADANFRLGDTHSVAFRAMGTDHESRETGRTEGYLLDAAFSKRGRNLRYSLGTYALSPEFRTDVGFVRRTDQRYVSATGGYRWWPEHWLRNWGPEFLYARNYDFAGVLQDEIADAGINLALARNMFVAGNVRRELERYRGHRFREDAVPRLRPGRHQPAHRNVARVPARRSGPLRGQGSPLSGPRARNLGVDQPAPGAALPLGDQRHDEPVHQSGPRRRRGVRRPYLPRPDDVPVHHPTAAAQYQRVQHAPRNARSQLPPYLPRQRGDGLLCRLRRPLPAGRPHRARSDRLGRCRRMAPAERRPPSYEPRGLPEAAVPVPLLSGRPRADPAHGPRRLFRGSSSPRGAPI